MLATIGMNVFSRAFWRAEALLRALKPTYLTIVSTDMTNLDVYARSFGCADFPFGTEPALFPFREGNSSFSHMLPKRDE